MADAVTDVVQGIAIIVGLLILLVAVIGSMGGVGAALASIDPARLHPFGSADRPVLDGLEAWAIPICGSVVAQELVARAIATRSPVIARRASLMGGGGYLALGMIPVFIGLVGSRILPGLENPERLLPLIAERLLRCWRRGRW